jgi:hypothetical protein
MAVNPGSKFVIDVVAQANKSSFSTAQQVINQFALTQQKLGVIAQNTTTITNQLANAQNNLNKAMGGGTIGGQNRNWINTIALGSALGKVYSSIANYLTDIMQKVPLVGEQLYYMNRRLGLPGTAPLFNMAFAGSMIGLSREQTLGTVESMGATARTNPGIAALMRQFGVKGNVGGTFSPEDQLKLVNQLDKLPYFIGAQFAQMMGMDEITYRQMTTNLQELNAQYHAHIGTMKEFGINTDKTSKDFAEFYRVLGRITDKLMLLFTEFADWFVVKFAPVFEWVDKTLGRIGGAINKPTWLQRQQDVLEYNMPTTSTERRRELAKKIQEENKTAGMGISTELPTAKGVHTEGLNPELAKRFMETWQALPENVRRRIWVTSAVRTQAEQWRAWLDFIHGKGPKAAYPGRSHHQFGEALDIHDYGGAFAAEARKHGLVQTVPGENWHYELDRRQPGTSGVAGTQTKSTNVEVNHGGNHITINNHGNVDNTGNQVKSVIDKDHDMMALRWRTTVEGASVR